MTLVGGHLIDFSDADPYAERPAAAVATACKSAFASHAQHLITAGYSPLPIMPGQKRPDLKGWQQAAEEQMGGELLAGFIRQDRHGLGVACGYDGLVAVDIDTEDEAIMAAVRSALPDSHIAKRGKKGRTGFYRAAGEIKNKKFKIGISPIVEILSTGSQTVLPPTIHPDTHAPYTWLGERALWDVQPDELPEITPDHIQCLATALAPWTQKAAEMLDASGRIDLTAPAKSSGASDSQSRQASYGLATIERRCKELAAASEGGRNTALYEAACRCGRWVHHGIVSKDALTAQLLNATKANGLLTDDGEEACRATIESGLEKSKGDPLPELSDDRKNQTQPAQPFSDVAKPFSDVAMIETRIGQLTRETEYETLKDVIGSIVTANLEPLAEDRLLTKVKSRIGGSLSTLRDQIKVLKRRLNATGDINRAPVKPAWDGMLIKDLLGKPERNEANVITALSNDPEFAGALMFDEFRLEIIVTKPLPWDPNLRDCRPWNDADDIRCAEWLQRREINVAPSTVSRSVQGVARQNTRHPVREYLHGLEWDGHFRLERFAVDYLGAADTPLNAKFASLWMISAVARIMRPGCKADHMLILEGPQGLQKSTAINTLVGDAWFTDDLEDVSSKDAKQQLRGAWVIEIAELDAIGRAEVSKIKAFLSRKVDRYRPPYGRYVMDVPRQCIFAGSVNPETYLRDETGNRRFWPIVCGAIDIPAIERDRDQLWAEAITRYEGGAVWWLTDPGLIAMSKKEQEARFQSDAWDDQIESWLYYDNDIRRLEPIEDVSIGEILQHVIRVEVAKWTRADQMRVSSYLKRNGWERYRVGGGDRSWRYRRVPTS